MEYTDKAEATIGRLAYWQCLTPGEGDGVLFRSVDGAAARGDPFNLGDCKCRACRNTIAAVGDYRTWKANLLASECPPRPE